MICELAIEPEGWLGADAEIAGLRRCDPDVVATLIGRYQRRLYRYLLRLVSDPAAAEDIFQQTWLRVIEKIRQYDAGRGFEPWLFSIARHLAIDHLRRTRPASLDEPRPGGSWSDAVPSPAPTALDRFLRSERTSLVMRQLERLPAIYREVLTLRFEEEMKIEEIAGLTGLPLGTVKSRLRRALLALREKVAE